MPSRRSIPTSLTYALSAFAAMTGLELRALGLVRGEGGYGWYPFESSLRESAGTTPLEDDWPLRAAWSTQVANGNPFWSVKNPKVKARTSCHGCSAIKMCPFLAEAVVPVRIGGEVVGAIVALARTTAALRVMLSCDKSGVLAVLETLSIAAASRWSATPSSKEAPDEEPEPLPLDLIKGNSPVLRRLKGMTVAAARTDSTVLILGETGVGKELFAMAVHAESSRRNRPFVAVNCAAIPENLIESELFGYEGGAFTGAKPGGKPGKFELASGGTIFLDEIGDLPTHVQAKLLRILEDRKVERVGGLRQIPVDVRIIAATNRDLAAMVKAHQFREDLFYRLNVIPLVIPPLRYHKDDLEALLGYFLKKTVGSRKTVASGRGNVSGRVSSPKRFSKDALAILYAYDWPGNIREVRNVVEYAVSMAADCDEITPDDLPPYVLGQQQARQWKKAALSEAMESPGVPASLTDLEYEAIRAALAKYGTTAAGKKAAADALGISRATLYRRLKKMRSGVSV